MIVNVGNYGVKLPTPDTHKWLLYSWLILYLQYYSKAHTKDALKWLNIYEKRSEISADEHSNPENTFASIQLRQEESDVPVLVCMTFADRLLAEMMDRDGKYNPSHAKIEIGRHFEV